MNTLEVVSLASDLIKFPSLTPKEAESTVIMERVQKYIADVLENIGFTVRHHNYGGEVLADGQRAPVIPNLFARYGTRSPVFAFVAHTDVVDPVDPGAWTAGPFEPTVRNGRLYGRGAEDMKGGLAAAMVAASRFVKRHPDFPGSIEFLVSGNEEGSGEHAMTEMVDNLSREDKPTVCLLPEPSSEQVLGDRYKIGSRGCFEPTITITCKSRHAAYPERGRNGLHVVLPILQMIATTTLDEGTELFPTPSNIEIVNINAHNDQKNSTSGQITVVLNIRFTDKHTIEGLTAWLEEMFSCLPEGMTAQVIPDYFNTAYVTPPGAFTALIERVVKEALQVEAKHSTTGGASDARAFPKGLSCIELGPILAYSHEIDESVSVDDLEKLVDLYDRVLEGYFQTV